MMGEGGAINTMMYSGSTQRGGGGALLGGEVVLLVRERRRNWVSQSVGGKRCASS
jgi:hypothetical protein